MQTHYSELFILSTQKKGRLDNICINKLYGMRFMLAEKLTVSALYSSMRSAITGNSAAMKAIGLSTSYEDGLTTLTLDESALKEALESDPDKVSSFFTGKDGLMSKMKDITDRYASTTLSQAARVRTSI